MKDYLDAAATCALSHDHDSAHAQKTQLPSLLAAIPNFEFGFIVPLGAATPPHSSVVHGYSSTDPGLPSDPSALEFVSFVIDAPAYKFASAKPVGKWLVAVDDAKEMTQSMNEQARKTNVPLWAKIRAYTLEQSTVSTTSFQSKLETQDTLQGTVATNFLYEGFESLREEDLKARPV